MKNESTIPKVIHYFWFGKNEMPEIFSKCLESWKRYCPEYEIKLWNEDNFDIGISPYCKEAYEQKKYAFVSDYARFYILYKYGGIYLDIDVEILKNIDIFLENDCFMGFEDRGQVAPGLIMGAKKNNNTVKVILDIYNNFRYFPQDKHNVCMIVTEYLKKNKKLQINDEIQKLEGITIYPMEYFCACDLINKEFNITENTYCIHHYNASWWTFEDKFKNDVRKFVYKFLGKEKYDKLKKLLKGK